MTGSKNTEYLDAKRAREILDSDKTSGCVRHSEGL